MVGRERHGTVAFQGAGRNALRAGWVPRILHSTLTPGPCAVRCRLSDALAALVGVDGLASLPFVLQMLWGYVKRNRLFDVRHGEREMHARVRGSECRACACECGTFRDVGGCAAP